MSLPKRSIGGFLADLGLNRNPEQFSFTFMRVTGVALTLYLLLHIYTLGHILGGTAHFDEGLESYNKVFGGEAGGAPTFGFAAIEWLLLVAVALHAANGLRLIVCDFVELSQRQRKLLFGAVAVTVLLCGASVLKFFPGL